MVHCRNFFHQRKLDTALWEVFDKYLIYNNYKTCLL